MNWVTGLSLQILKHIVRYSIYLLFQEEKYAFLPIKSFEIEYAIYISVDIDYNAFEVQSYSSSNSSGR